MPFPRSLFAAVLALTAAVLPALAAAQGEAAASVDVPLPAVTVASVIETDLELRVVVSGTLVAREEVEVYPRVTGPEILEILVDIGDTVTAGQVLARLDDATLAAQLAQADANLASARAGIAQAESQLASADATATQARTALDRANALRERGDLAQATYDQAAATAQSADAAVAAARAGVAAANAGLQQAQAARDLAALNLGWTVIEAPVAGTVLARNARLGALSASGGTPLFRIARDSLIEVEAEVIESDMARLKVGDPATVTISGQSDIPGRVRLISPLIDPLTRLGLLRITLDAPDAVRVGLFARSVIVVDTHAALVLPASAVLTTATEQYVQKVVDGVVRKTPVQAGGLSEGQREILSGLAAGDTVILRAGAFFRDGDRVAPVPAAAAAEPKP